jgi:hypothetical protein
MALIPFLVLLHLQVAVEEVDIAQAQTLLVMLEVLAVAVQTQPLEALALLVKEMRVVQALLMLHILVLAVAVLVQSVLL